MATVAEDNAVNRVSTNLVLADAVIDSFNSALTMCDATARCVGIARVPSRDSGTITGMIGVHGNVSGFITVNMAERFAIKAVEGLLQETYGELSLRWSTVPVRSPTSSSAASNQR